jgi:hypothetical protein
MASKIVPAEEGKNLEPGWYWVHWKDGHDACAVVSIGSDGTRFIVPEDWCKPRTDFDWQRDIESMEFLDFESRGEDGLVPHDIGVILTDECEFIVNRDIEPTTPLEKAVVKLIDERDSLHTNIENIRRDLRQANETRGVLAAEAANLLRENKVLQERWKEAVELLREWHDDANNCPQALCEGCPLFAWCEKVETFLDAVDKKQG